MTRPETSDSGEREDALAELRRLASGVRMDRPLALVGLMGAGKTTIGRRLAAVLKKAGARYSIASASETGAAFPPPIREQLGRYGVRDNIVIKGDATTQILKIAAIRNDPMPLREQGALARRMVLEERAGARMQDTLARLTQNAQIAYFRPSAAPRPAPAQKSAEK